MCKNYPISLHFSHIFTQYPPAEQSFAPSSSPKIPFQLAIFYPLPLKNHANSKMMWKYLHISQLNANFVAFLRAKDAALYLVR